MNKKQKEIKLNLDIDENSFFYLKMDISNPITKKTAYGCKIILDTGAAYSLIKPHLVKAIGVEKYGDTNISNPLSLNNESTSAYKINMGNDKIIIPNIPCLEIKDPMYPADFVIGIQVIIRHILIIIVRCLKVCVF